MKSIFRGGLIFGLLAVPLVSVFSFDLTVTQTPGGPTKDYTLSWEAVEPSTTDAVVTYYIFGEFGSDAVTLPPLDGSVSFSSHANFLRAAGEDTTAIISACAGTRGFVVVSSDSFTGAHQVSNTIYHSFIHLTQANSGSGSATIGRTDGDGTHRGVDQKWNFTYFMDTDALVRMRMYGPGTTFTTDANGFVASASNVAISTIVDNAPRSGELADGSVPASDGENGDQWFSRASSGVIVNNGIYYLLIEATLDSGQGCFSEGAVRDSSIITVPVDILRIINLTATPITLNNTRSSISYFLTGPANVRVVIARPGSAFVVDPNGDIQAASRTTGAIDNTLVVSTFTFQRDAGENIESWDGTSSTGTVMPSGVYTVGISARDDFGNTAISIAGDEHPLFANISLERAPGSTTGSTGGSGGGTTSDTTPPSIAAMTADGGSFSNGATFSGSVTTITVRLTDTSGIGFGLSNIVVVNPNNVQVPGTLSNNGSDTLTLVFTSPQEINGLYTMTVTGADAIGNTQTFDLTFRITIQLTQTAFETNTEVYPNPAKGVANAMIDYDLDEEATVSIDIFNILGEKVYSARYENQAPGVTTQTWPLSNSDGEKVGSGLYLVRIKAAGSSTVETVKKLVVIR